MDLARAASLLSAETAAAVNALRRRHADARAIVARLSAVPTVTPPVLKTPQVAAAAAAALAQFRPVPGSGKEQVALLESAQSQAINRARASVESLAKEHASLVQLRNDIANARPLDQLTVADVAAAVPALDETVARMASRGQWRVPGYYEKFGEFIIGL